MLVGGGWFPPTPAFPEVLAPTLVPRGSIPGGVFGAFGILRADDDGISGVSTI